MLPHTVWHYEAANLMQAHNAGDCSLLCQRPTKGLVSRWNERKLASYHFLIGRANSRGRGISTLPACNRLTMLKQLTFTNPHTLELCWWVHQNLTVLILLIKVGMENNWQWRLSNYSTSKVVSAAILHTLTKANRNWFFWVIWKNMT